MEILKRKPKCECCGCVREEVRDVGGKLIEIDRETMLCIHCEEQLNQNLEEIEARDELFDNFVNEALEKLHMVA